MKIRQGFVSNSSSSSFVLKGFVLPKDSLTFEDKLNIMDKFGFNYKKYDKYINKEDIDDIFYYEFRDHISDKIGMLHDSEDGAPDSDSIAIGEMLFDCEDYTYTMVVDTDLTPTLQQIKEVFNINDSVKVVCGTRYC